MTTFTRTTTDTGATRSTCTTCGDFIASAFGPRLVRFEATHECSELVAA